LLIEKKFKQTYSRKFSESYCQTAWHKTGSTIISVGNLGKVLWEVLKFSNSKKSTQVCHPSSKCWRRDNRGRCGETARKSRKVTKLIFPACRGVICLHQIRVMFIVW